MMYANNGLLVLIHLFVFVFCHTFLRVCESYKVETWYKGSVDIPESSLYFDILLHLQFLNIKFFSHFFSGTLMPTKLEHGTHMHNVLVYCVCQHRTACAYYLFISSFFFSCFQNDFFCHFCFSNCT